MEVSWPRSQPASRNPSGTSSPRCCPPARSTIPWAATASASLTASSSTSIQILVFGCGYRRIADHTCSATTLRRRRDEWITLGVADQLHRLALAAYDRIHGLEVEHLDVDGCITKAPCGGQVAGPSPVDRRKQGLKRSVATDAHGVPSVGAAGPGQSPR
jgi:hypothetical protein